MDNVIIEEDPLPQPYRFINKIVLRCVDQAMSEIHNLVVGNVTEPKVYADNPRIPKLSPTGAFRLPATSTCTAVVGKDVVVGGSDAMIRTYSTIMMSCGMTSPVLECGPITHVAGTINGEGYPTYAALGSKGFMVFAFVPVDQQQAEKRKSVTRSSLTTSAIDPTTGIGKGQSVTIENEIFTVFGFGQSPVKPSEIVSFDLSVDGKFVSIATASPSGSVYVYNVSSDPPAKVAPLKPGVPKPSNPVIDKPCAIFNLPEEKYMSSLGFVRPNVHFVFHPPNVVAGLPSDALRPGPLTHTAYVVWLGTTAASYSSLISANPNSGAILARANEMASQRVVLRPQSEGNPGAAVAKGGAAKPDPKKAGGAGGPAGGSGPTGNELCPLPTDDLYPSLRNMQCPNFVCATSISKSSQTLALAMAEGVTWLWSTRLGCVLSTVHTAKHRTRHMSHRAMIPTFVSLCGDHSVVVSQSILGVKNGNTHLVCADVETGEIISKNKGWPMVLGAATHGPLQTSFLASSDDVIRVVEAKSGAVLAILVNDVEGLIVSPRAADGPASSHVQQPTLSPGSQDLVTSTTPVTQTRSPKEVLQELYKPRSSRVTFSFYDDSILVLPIGGSIADKPVIQFSATKIFATSYPSLAPNLFGFEQLVTIVESKPHAERDAAALLSLMTSGKQPNPPTNTNSSHARKSSLRRASNVSGGQLNHTLSQGGLTHTQQQFTSWRDESTTGGAGGVGTGGPMRSLHEPAPPYLGEKSHPGEYVKYLVEVRDLGRGAREARMKAKLQEWKMGMP
eukprot:PhF_6_TR18868/c0_g1_i3/m.27430